MPIDLKTIVATVIRRFWLIVVGGGLTFLAIAYITLNQTPIYKSEASVIVNTSGMNVVDLGAVLGGIAPNTAEIDTEVEKLGSKSLLTRVAEKQNLMEDPEFNWTLVPREPGLMDGVKSFVVGLTGGEPAVAEDPYAGLTEAEKNAAILESVVDTLQRNISVGRLGTTYIINIEASSTDGAKASMLANAVADAYLNDQLEAKLEATRRATGWLSESTEDLRGELEAKERAVADFMAERGIESVGAMSVNENNMQILSSQRLQLEADFANAQSRLDAAEAAINSGIAGGVSEILNSQAMNDLKQQQTTVARRKSELETLYGPRHPELIRVNNELSDLRRRISSEESAILRSLQGEVSAARQRLNGVNSRLTQTRGRLVQNTRDSVRLGELQRDAEATRALYEQVLGRFKQTDQQEGLVEADARILSSASPAASPSSPKTALQLLLGLILGSLVGGALALIAELFDTKLSTAEDIERKLGSKSIASVPLIRNPSFLGLGDASPADFMVENPLSAYAESVRYLRASIAFSDLDAETKTVAITSSLPDEGKTSLTLSLGRMSAMSGSRTLIIDGDFRRRQLTEASGLDPEIGFIEYLFGAGELDEAIARDPKSTADILPLTMTGHTPHDVFGTRAFDEMMVELRGRYDLILIDTGPLLLMAEARVVAGKADKTILIVRWRHTNRSAARNSLNLLTNFKADLLGVALNMVDLNRRRHHNDPGASYKAYRKYYTMEPKRTVLGRSNKPGKPAKAAKGGAMRPPPKARPEGAPPKTTSPVARVTGAFKQEAGKSKSGPTKFTGN